MGHEVSSQLMGATITTADQLREAQHIGRCELIRGEFLKLIPPGADHGRIAMDVGRRIANFVHDHKLGTVFAAETGFWLARDPDTVRAPDVAFVRAERAVVPRRGYFSGAPDLAVEVLSPSDRPGYVREKTAEWLEAGTLAVWNVDPENRTVTVHESGAEPVRLVGGEVLSGGSVLPGFSVPVNEIFD